MNILITELMWEKGIKNLTDANFNVNYMKSLSEERNNLLSIIHEYDALIVRNKTIVDKELLDKGKKLKVIGRLGVGMDNIDVNFMHKKDVKLVIAKNANSTSVAEYVIATLLEASRMVFQANLSVREGNWLRKEYTGSELDKKTIGLIGLGDIAHRVAKRAKAFGMKVIGYDPFIAPYENIFSETKVEKMEELKELLASSDFVSLHLPLTTQTRNIINKETLKYMKSNSYLINTSRGELVNEKDLYYSLESNKLSGAYLDVFSSEPIQQSSILLLSNKIKFTPHIAGLTDESQNRVSKIISEEVIKVLHGKESQCTV